MKTWIKLYTEMLQDPKMGRLSDRQYRTCVNLFLLAGQIDQAGALPSIDDMAYYLRMDETELLRDLQALADVNILTLQGGDCTVTQFAYRQARNPSETPEEVKRRVQEYRQRKAADCNDGVTACNVSVTPSNDIEESRVEEKREEADAPAAPLAVSPFVSQAFGKFETNIGLISSAYQSQEITDMLSTLESRHLESWWDLALRVTLDQNKKSWAYMRAVLKGSLSDGKPPGTRPPGGNGHGQPARASPERVNAQGLSYNEYQAAIIRGDVPDGSEWHPVEAT